MLKSLTRIFFILLGVDIVLFFCTVLTAMGDDEPTAVPRAFYWTLNYVLGFPLALINSDYPFFLKSDHFPPAGLVFIAINNSILSLVIWWIIRAIKWGWN